MSAAAELAPWHDSVTCACGCPVAPVGGEPPHLVSDPTHVHCLGCGDDWRELDTRRLARIWWSLGAYDGALLVQRGVAP